MTDQNTLQTTCYLPQAKESFVFHKDGRVTFDEEDMLRTIKLYMSDHWQEIVELYNLNWDTSDRLVWKYSKWEKK